MGSGYLVSAGRVLTAAHVIQDREGLEVVIDNGGQGHQLEVSPDNAWFAQGIDIGIIQVNPDWVEMNAPQATSVGPVSFGRVDGEARIRARLYGFAAFKLRDDDDRKYRDSEELDCEIRRVSNIMEKSLQLVPKRPWEPDTSDPGLTRWSSMSGTAVWVDDVIVAVVSQYRPNEEEGVLIAQPVERVLSLRTRQQNEALDLLGLVPGDFVVASSVPASLHGGKPSSDLVVWPVPAESDWGSITGISGDRHAESLLTHLVLSRLPRTQIVVDPVDSDLGNDLNRTERAYRAARAQKIDSLSSFQPRRWYTIDLDEDPENRGNSVRRMLLDGGSWSRDAEPAFVLRSGKGEGLVDRSAHSVVARIRDEYPESCIVVHLQANSLIKAVLRARHLTRYKGFPAMPIYLHRRSEFRHSSEPLATVRSMRDLLGVLDDAATRAEQRSRLQLNSPASLATSPYRVKSRVLARRLVEEIELKGIPATPRPGEDLDEALLGALRDHMPKLYPPMLYEYAAHRTGTGWAASMAFAARSDHFDRWIASAETFGVHPDERHPWPFRYGREPYDRLAAALERGVVRHPEQWRHPFESAVAVDDYVTTDSNWEEAETWRRLSAQIPDMTVDAAMMLMCSADAAHPIVARVLGYAPITGEGLVRDRVDELRRLLAPHDFERGSLNA